MRSPLAAISWGRKQPKTRLRFGTKNPVRSNSTNLTLSPVSSNGFILSGTTPGALVATTINQVETGAGLCGDNVASSACGGANMVYGPVGFTGVPESILVAVGQIVQVTVTISFS